MEAKSTKRIFIAIGVVAAILVMYLSLFVVDETQHTIVTLFGKPTRTVSEPGLYFKSPFHTNLTLDKRVLFYNPLPNEYLTRDKKNIIVDNFVCWKIIDPLDFYVTVNDVAKAEVYLNDLISSQVSAILGEYDLSSLVSINPEEMKIDEITQKVEDSCRQRAKKDYSIEIASVELKQLILPQQNKQANFDRTRAERERTAKQYRAEGQEEALKIRASTDKECREILSEAIRTAEIIKGEGDAEAIKIYGEAHGKNMDFFNLQRRLQAYQIFLNEKTTVVLSSDSDLLRLFTEGHEKKGTRVVNGEGNQATKKHTLVKK